MVKRALGITKPKIKDLPIVVFELLQKTPFPSDFTFLKNKHEWTPMLFQHETRRLLYVRLSYFVMWITSQIQDTIADNGQIEQAGAPALSPPTPPEDYQMLEQYVSFQFLDRIMTSTSIQLPLTMHFGAQKPAFNTSYFDTFVASTTGGKRVSELIELIIIKVFVVLAISSALFTYVYVPEQMSSSARNLVLTKESQSLAVHHEVTFFQGGQFMPLVTFMSPDDADAFESMGGTRFHWTNYVQSGNLTLEVHKFITPRLTGAFMHYFSFEGETWAR